MGRSYHSDDRRRHRHRHHHRDSDSYYGHSNRSYSPHRDHSDRRKRVPGLVNDPNDNYHSSRDNYRSYERNNSRDKKHESSTLNAVSTLQPYNNKTTVVEREPRKGIFMAPKKYDHEEHYVIVPNLLGSIPVFCGFALLIAAVILPTWIQQFVTSTNTSQSDTQETTCQTREEYATAGLPINSLEQATRGLIIIAIIVSFVGFLGSIYLGIAKFRLHFGSIITGCIHLLAAMCAIAGMGCYSGFISNQTTSDGSGSTSTVTQAGTAFYLGWFGAGAFVVSCVTSFLTFAMPP